MIDNLLNFLNYNQNHTTQGSSSSRPDLNNNDNPSNPNFTVNRGRSTNPSGRSNFSQLYSGDEAITTWKMLLGLQERNKFMKRICFAGLVLKKFARKRVPVNLCYEWQKDEHKKQVLEEARLRNKLVNKWDLYWLTLSIHHWCDLASSA